MTAPDQGLAQIAALLKNTTPPDVLETIAHISSDEVLTPPRLANQVLDLLPPHIWHDPRVRILDPAVKSGVFLREAAKRLMAGLAQVIPDVDARREHILRKMLYGVAITELTALMSRRSLYCASDATREKNPAAPENCFSAVIMPTPEGNVAFPATEHDYDARGKCRVCGANRGDLDGEHREGRENHAYPFIHRTIEEIFGDDMRFDVIIGNPPYQLKDGGFGASASPIYQLFVEKAKALEPKYLSMIIPARWYAGGKGLDEFRADMLKSRNIKNLVDIPTLYDAFPGVKIRGGVCYFLMDEDHDGPAEIYKVLNGNKDGSSSKRYLDEFDVLVRDNESVSILRKVIQKETESGSTNFFDSNISRSPYGIGTNQHGRPSPDGLRNPIKVYGSRKVSWMTSDEVNVEEDSLKTWRVLMTAAQGTSGAVEKMFLRPPIIASPGEISSATYLIAGKYDSQEEAENCASYLKTRFVRFLVSLRKNTQHANRDVYKFVPLLDMDRPWSDDDLFEMYHLSEEEVNYIKEKIGEML
jgi:site-specific DNA-methyltransferase (adenine-specific)